MGDVVPKWAEAGRSNFGETRMIVVRKMKFNKNTKSKGIQGIPFHAPSSIYIYTSAIKPSHKSLLVVQNRKSNFSEESEQVKTLTTHFLPT